MKVSKYNVQLSLFYVTLTILIANKMYSFPSSLSALKIFETDGVFTQAQIQSFIDGAILGSTNHLGFPFGYSHWLSPQFSVLEAILIWFIGNTTSITNYGIISIIGLLTLILNLSSMHFLGSVLSKNRLTSLTFGIVGLTTPFALNSLMHPHVMKIFLIPIILVFLIKLVNKNRIRKRFIVILILSILGSSLFWINVMLAIFLILIFIQFLDVLIRNSKKDFLINYIKVGSYIFLGFITNTILYYYNSKLLGDRDRLAWQSDLFSGKFTDVLLGSPFLNRFVNQLKDVVPGSSPETWAMMLGIPLMIAFAIGVYFSISFVSFNSGNELALALKQISIVSILFFVLGGLSNLQASFFVLIGSASPMRTWSRLSILVAILGLTLLYLTLNSRENKTRIVSASLVFLAFVDLLTISKLFESKSNWSEQEIFKATTFIKSELKPCPILQIPIDTYLVPQSAQDQGYRYYWSGLVPYVVLPDFKWTAATYTNSAGWKQLEKLPTLFTDETFAEISKTYCAILFDKNFSQYQIDRKAGLKSTQGLWPGLQIDSKMKPQFEDTRFSVYLLNSVTS